MKPKAFKNNSLAEAEFRKAFIGNFEKALALSLTRHESEIVETIIYLERQSSIGSSREIARLHGAAVVTISTQLKRLYDKGYLNRKRVADPTGGIMYEYAVRPDLRSNTV